MVLKEKKKVGMNTLRDLNILKLRRVPFVLIFTQNSFQCIIKPRC